MMYLSLYRFIMSAKTNHQIRKTLEVLHISQPQSASHQTKVNTSVAATVIQAR